MKKEKILTTVLLLIAVFVFTGFAYAYLAGGISNANRQEATITTGTMNLTFRDGTTSLAATSMTIGTSVTKTFTIENTGTLEGTASMYFKDLINTYMAESMSYRLEYATSENGTYSVLQAETNVPQSSTVSEKLLYGNITVPAGTKLYYKLIITFNNLPNVDQTADVNAVLNTKFTLKAGHTIESESDITLAALSLTANSGTPDFSQSASSTSGIYAAEDNYGTSYYFRGNVTNNKVAFGQGATYQYCHTTIIVVDDSEEGYWGYSNNAEMGYYDTEEECLMEFSSCSKYGYSEKCYSSFEVCEQNNMDSYYLGECSEKSTDYENLTWKIIRVNGDGSLKMQLTQSRSMDFSSEADYENKMSVNYIESVPKSILDEWYKKNLLNEYAQYISEDVLFCNDTNNDGGGADLYYYDVYYRISSNSPSLICNEPKEGNINLTQLTTSNGLTYPIGLITADEVYMTGITSNNPGLTLSPKYYDGTWEFASEMYYHLNGLTSHSGEDSSNPIDFYPVINLAAEYARTLVWDSSNGYYKIP